MRFILFTAIALTVLASGAGAYTMMGSVDSYDKDGHTLAFECENGRVRVSFLADSIVRVHMAPAGRDFPADDLHEGQNGPYAVANYEWTGVEYAMSEAFDADLEGMVYPIKAGRLVVKVRKQPFKLAFYGVDGRLLVMEAEGVADAGLGYEGEKVFETMDLADDEHFFGFGAHNHPLDMRGRQMVCTATELDSLDAVGGFPVPFFFSSRGYGIFFNNLDDDVTFELGTTPGRYSFSATSGEKEGWDMDYYFIYGPSFEDIARRYISIVGRPVLPEKWFFGHIQHHCCDWTGQEVIEVAERYREGRWPCDVLIMDYQAMDPGFEWAEKFKDHREMYRIIDELGFKTAYSCALFDDVYEWKSYDPTETDATGQYWSLHVPRVKDGIDFWRQDNSERSWKYTGKKTLSNGYEAHELFGSLWAKNVVEGMESLGLYGRPVISRGGPVGGHRYIVPWPGDLSHGLEFLAADLAFVRNGGLAGYAAIAVDLGGFIDRGGRPPLEEQNLIRRTIDIIPIIPISKCQGAGDASAKLPWLFTGAQQDLMRRFLRFRYSLHPYTYSAAVEAHLTGRPILAPLVYDHQNDPNTYDKDYTFMLGKQLLAAPVMEETEKREVYLPAGRWFHYWTGKAFEGPATVTVNAPLYETAGLPLFVKAGAVIAQMPDMLYIHEKKPEPLTLDIWPADGIGAEWVLHDCESIKGPFKKTALGCSGSRTQTEIAAGGISCPVEIVVHLASAPSSVEAQCGRIRRIEDRKAYEAAGSGWYHGPGVFRANPQISTINIKLPSGSDVIIRHGEESG